MSFTADVGTGGRQLYRWCDSDEDAACLLDDMKTSGELKDGDTVQFVRWLAEAIDDPRNRPASELPRSSA